MYNRGEKLSSGQKGQPAPEQPAVQAPALSEFGMRVHESWLNGVAFIGRILRKGNLEDKRLIGAAFCAGIELAHKMGWAFYLLTAKHTADVLKTGGEWFIRFNTTDGCCDD